MSDATTLDEATLTKLGFNEVRDVLASYCASSLGKQLAASLKPSPKRKQVRQWLGQVSELTTVAEQHGWPPLGGVHDIRNYVRASAFPAPLESDELARIADTLQATSFLRTWLDKLGEDARFLWEHGRRIANLGSIGDTIRESIDSRGLVRDNATPKLASIRSGIEHTRNSIRKVFERELRHSNITRMLQYSGVTYHGDRMVLPLKAEYRGRIPGIIHRSSDSGATLFVEPAESVELNNSVVRLREQESKEITTILRALSRHVNANATSILETIRAIAVLDLVAAKCRYAKKRDCIVPEISENGVVDLHEARHPLLVELFSQDKGKDAGKRQVVPIDMRLGQDFDVLIITGPNTGGKTVAIKTIGLLAAMTQCGIPIPAGEGSIMATFDQIHIDVGDEQSIEQSLSTFSSHLATLLRILREAGPRSLVLIDELGAGTDPDEGAAIGQAVIAELLELRSKAVITTHLSALKAVAYTTKRVDNAAVEFDVETLQPTYRVRLGEPGNSNALIIAKRLGMPARIVQQAKGFLDNRTQALNKAISGTLHSRRQAEKARKDAREEALVSKREREIFEQKQKELNQTREAFARWTEWVHNLRSGDEVFVRTLKRLAKVVRMQLHNQKALVSTGTIDIEVPLSDIEPPQSDD